VIGTDCQADILQELEMEIEKRMKEEFEKRQAVAKRLSLSIPMDSSGGEPADTNSSSTHE